MTAGRYRKCLGRFDSPERVTPFVLCEGRKSNSGWRRRTEPVLRITSLAVQVVHVDVARRVVAVARASCACGDTGGTPVPRCQRLLD